MRLNFCIFVLLIFGLGFSATLIGVDGIGLDRSPSNAAIIRNGLARQNPAINAFENKTKFGTTIQFEYTNAIKDNNSIGISSFDVPSIYMILPLGFAGTFGLGLEQIYSASNRFELVDEALDANVKYSSRTGIYELAPSYALRLPLLTNFAIGTSYRIFFGNSYSSLERGKSESWGEDAWIANNVKVSNVENGHFESKSQWWRHLGASLHFNKKTLDYFVSYFPSIELEKSITKKTQFSNTDTLQARDTTEHYKLPKQFATGVHFLFGQSHNLSIGYEQKDASSYYAEYKRTGTGLHYSPFFQRNNFGISGWYAEKYEKAATEYGASVFSDLLLGRRGTLVGLALFGGYRQAEKTNWDEPFFGLKFNLTGVSNWGTSARRR